MSRYKIILIVAVLVLIAGAIYIYKEYHRTNKNINKEASAFNLSAIELVRSFTENDSLASRLYVGKIISVNGLVRNLDKDNRGYYTVSLGDTASMSSVKCSVDSLYTIAASALKPGVSINIKGNCTGFNKDELLGLDVMLNRCVIK